MKQWRKVCLCKKAYKLSIISFSLCGKYLQHYYLDSFYDKWYFNKYLKKEI